MILRCGNGLIDAESNLVALAGVRAKTANFSGLGAPTLRVERSSVELPNGIALSGSPAPWGFVKFSGRTLLAHIPDDAFAAEAALRIAWQFLIMEQGGVLLHSSSFHWNGRGVMAVAQSGGGKSTIARLSLAAGATLLSDEVTAVFPDGQIFGTPFRSDTEEPGSPGPARLRGFFLLAKGNEERVDVVDAREAIPAMWAQTFRPFDALAQARGPWFERLTLAASAVGTYRLTFRKDPQAGVFVRDWATRG